MINKTKFHHTAFKQARLTTLAASITGLICQATLASDIDIYTAPSTAAGATTVLLMLDTSGSMRFIDYESNDSGTNLSTYDPGDGGTTCPSGFAKVNATTTFGITDRQSTSYYYCTRNNREDAMKRIHALRIGLLKVLLGDNSDPNNKIEPLDDNIYLGIATFSGNKGQIRLDARKLSDVYTYDGTKQSHRKHMAKIASSLSSSGGTPTPFAYAEAGAYLMGTRTNNSTYGNSTSNYTQPDSIKNQTTKALKECSAQGIYFLTDGRPEPNAGSDTARSMMRSALNDTGFSCNDGSPLGDLWDTYNENNASPNFNNQTHRKGYYHPSHAWNCTGSFAKALLDPTKNDAEIKILTAVVGFGKDFDGSTPTNDVLDAMDWGDLGEGGWYSGKSAQDIVESFTQFLQKVKTDIPGVSTGNATIPVDALNSNTVQPFGYFPQFVPKVGPGDGQQTWFGNLKKYHAVQGSLYKTYNETSKAASGPVMTDNQINDVEDLWNNATFVTTSKEAAFKHGVLSQLKRGYTANETPQQRLVLTDYNYDSGTITKNLDLSYRDSNNNLKYRAITTSYTTTSTTNNDPKLSHLMSLLGYKNAIKGTDLTKTTVTTELPQVGSILHSQPLLLTQEGLPSVTGDANSAAIDTKNRKDYILFGTTQGVLHVVDAKSGKEIFAFTPEEMIRKQPAAFKLDAEGPTGGKAKLYYGIDGEWASHTIYVAKTDGTLTVNGDTRSITENGKTKDIDLEGKQWVYGGLRMGGRSYYGLDLTTINEPKIKFHIDPDTQKVYYLNEQNKLAEKSYPELAKMGQSWSKPTIGYVNWKGERKLVMFVGGGYDAGGDVTDANYGGDGFFNKDYVDPVTKQTKNGTRNGYGGYENPNYDQDSNTFKIGAGVYMFDADNGDLLWSAAGSHSADKKAGDNNLKLATGKTDTINMNYSIASQIKTVDRNNDGLVDHLYFGDLKGQAFRIDINNAESSTTSPLVSQASRILNVGENRRFFSTPTFTAHGTQGTVVVSFASGNRSSPMHGKSTTALTGDGFDGVFAIFDYEAYGSAYPKTTPVRTLDAQKTTEKLKLIENLIEANEAQRLQKRPTIDATTGDGGWYYLFKKFDPLAITNTHTKQILKNLGTLVAIENDLYVPIFDASKAGTTGACSAGVAGQTNLQRFCLPYGICAENINIELGAGIGEVIMGGGRDGDNNKRSIFVLNEDKKGGASGTTTQIKNYGGPLKFIPNRWYERYAKDGG